MKKSRKNVIGLDLGKSVVKMVEFSKKDREIKTVATLFLDPDDWNNEPGLSAKIKEWVAGKKQAKSVEVVTAVPGEYCVIKNIDLPEDETNIEEAIHWEMEQYLSSPAVEFLIDYQKVTVENQGVENRYLVVAYRKTEIEKIKRILDTPQNPLTVVDVDAFAVLNALETNYPEDISRETVLIKADLNGVNCLSTKEGRFLSQKFIPIKDDFLILDKSERTTIIIDLIKQINTYLQEKVQSAGGQSDSCKFILCGDFSADPEFCQLFESSVSVSVGRLNSFKVVVFPHDAEYAEKVQETAPQCATAVGLALRFCGDTK